MIFEIDIQFPESLQGIHGSYALAAESDYYFFILIVSIPYYMGLIQSSLC